MAHAVGKWMRRGNIPGSRVDMKLVCVYTFATVTFTYRIHLHGPHESDSIPVECISLKLVKCKGWFADSDFQLCLSICGRACMCVAQISQYPSSSYTQIPLDICAKESERGDFVCKALACPGRSKLPSAKLSCSAQVFTLTTISERVSKENHITHFVFCLFGR